MIRLLEIFLYVKCECHMAMTSLVAVRKMAANNDFYLRYYVGHHGKFGHEFLEFEFRPDGETKHVMQMALGAMVFSVAVLFLSRSWILSGCFSFYSYELPRTHFRLACIAFCVRVYSFKVVR